jgi:hypothetical protein
VQDLCQAFLKYSLLDMTQYRLDSSPRFADPWRFRIVQTRPVSFASIDGRSLEVSCFRRGGCPYWQVAPTSRPSDTRSLLTDLRRRVSATFARYRSSEICTKAELRTIEALWIEGLSLRALARRDRVTPTAVADRISRLERKAPEFWNWWRLKHRRRRRCER